MTRRLTIDPAGAGADILAPAVAWLREGGLIVFPTDTFYGVTADPRNARAIADLFDWKGRAGDAALPFVAASGDQVREWFGEPDPLSMALAARFWPGPLSIVLPVPEGVVPAVHGGAGTLAVRVPDHRVARALAAAIGRPLPATSANRSGEPPVREVEALGGLIDDLRVFVIDAGATPGGAASTIVDARRTPPTLVREGAVPWIRVLESIDR